MNHETFSEKDLETIFGCLVASYELCLVFPKKAATIVDLINRNQDKFKDAKKWLIEREEYIKRHNLFTVTVGGKDE